jgi:4-hydroxy-2-oxoheptanedioate aldolase
MNSIEREMLVVLKSLRDDFSCIQIKAEFEAEGTRMEELMRLKDVTTQVNLPIIMKIGGAESVTDVYNCLSVGVAGIIAPMVETPYSLYKYECMIENMIAPDNAADIEFFFNMETFVTYENFAEMLETKKIDRIQGVTIGRVDLAGSLNADRNMVDSEKFFEICENTCRIAKTKGLKCALGGAISSKSECFIKRLTDQNLLDKFETRKVVFDSRAIYKGNELFDKALEFELLWLKSKRRYYSRVKAEDEARIEMLEQRLKRE